VSVPLTDEPYGEAVLLHPGGGKGGLSLVTAATFQAVYAPSGAGPAVAGSLDWALAPLATFAAAPQQVVQLPTTTAWLGENLQPNGYAPGRPCEGDSVGWFLAAAAAGVEVRVVLFAPP